MIVIYGPYPHAHLVRDGWMRRIATLERIFAERERAYVFPADPAWATNWRDYRLHTHRVADGATFTYLDFRFAHHHRHLAGLIARAEFVYAHTSHSTQHLLPFYCTGKIVTDLHGIAPEEEELQGKPGRAAFYAGLEEAMVRHSAALVTVTRAMADHFRRKYPGSDRPSIQLPIVEDLGDDVALARPERPRPVVVYVGGLQRWQNVDRMLAVVAACRDRCEFRFYTDAPEALRARASAAGVAEAMRIGTAAPTELPAIYRDADYGFVLRDDIAVNRVSCPTKLSEYLALGVIPLVALAEIGDFATLGYRHVRVEDLVAGRLPAVAALPAMREQNRAVFRAIQADFADGERALRALRVAPPPQPPAASLLLTTYERTAVFPLRGARLEYERDDGAHTLPIDDVVTPKLDLDVALPGRGPLRALRFRPGDVPLVTAPLVAALTLADGSVQPLALAGGHTVDAYGNWVFDDRDATVAATTLPAGEPTRLSLRGDYLLFGLEALVAGAAAPPATPAWLASLRRTAARMPGAAAAWRTLQRLRRR